MRVISMNSINQFAQEKNEIRSRWLTIASLVSILLLGAFLRFYQLGSSGYGNEYYAATVKSMLTSWHNFFFVAFEPGGSVSVDKPPLGFWLEAASALLFGVNGFALALPNALAGLLSIFLVFVLVKKQFGRIPALIAALVLACLPITVATERNNTIDGMLVCTLLLSTWAFWKSVEKGKPGYLFLGVVLLGLGFNIKMLQAFMILPALYLFYFLGTRAKGWKRLLHLGLATLVLAGVSFSWTLIVDAVPASQRPYVGSSTNNTVMELIFGHNGIERFTKNSPFSGGERESTGTTPNDGAGGFPPGGNTLLGNPASGQLNQTNFPGGAGVQGNFDPPPAAERGGRVPQTQPGGAPGQNGDGLNAGFGQLQNSNPSLLRLFTPDLGTQVSWLLPVALVGIALLFALLKRLNVSKEQLLAGTFWATWLIPIMLYFSFTTGTWHSYYLIMLGPAIAALTGIAFWELDQLRTRSTLVAKILLTLLSAGTVGYAFYLMFAYANFFKALLIVVAIGWFVSILAYWVRPRVWSLLAVSLVCLVAPLYWTILTVENPKSDENLPSALPAMSIERNSYGVGKTTTEQQTLIDYLLANTEEGSYLVATLNAQEASPFILATSRPVLTFGGFLGGDNIISVTQLQEMVRSGKLRFVLSSGGSREKEALFAWTKKNCSVVQLSGLETGTKSSIAGDGGMPSFNQNSTLYDCKKTD